MGFNYGSKMNLFYLPYSAVQVYVGQLKFNVELERWPFASDGQSVDVDVITKIPPGRAMKRREGGGQRRGRPVEFELGADAIAYFPTKVGYSSLHNNTITSRP